jgi:hypothetical protein
VDEEPYNVFERRRTPKDEDFDILKERCSILRLGLERVGVVECRDVLHKCVTCISNTETSGRPPLTGQSVQLSSGLSLPGFTVSALETSINIDAQLTHDGSRMLRLHLLHLGSWANLVSFQGRIAVMSMDDWVNLMQWSNLSGLNC